MPDFRFEKMKRSQNGEVIQNHLYVTYNQFCQCDCACCRNKTFPEEVMKQQHIQLDQKIVETARYFRHIIFGGGEPLFQIENIMSVISSIKKEPDNFLHNWSGPYFDPDDNEIKFSIVTNGDSEIFLTNINNACYVCRDLKKIILSRYHHDDDINQKIFKAKRKLISREDIDELCLALRRKIQLSCLCQKGGIQSADDAVDYIKWAAELRIFDIMFSNFQEDVTPEEVKESESSGDLLKSIQERIVTQWNFVKEDTIVFSAGYTVTNYNGYVPIETTIERVVKVIPKKWNWLLRALFMEPQYEGIAETVSITKKIPMSISFREFISDTERMEKEWKNARRKTFNYSIMPNGEMYEDWSCKNTRA